MMTTGDIGAVKVDGKDIEVVTQFVFLGAKKNSNGKSRNGRTNINMEGQRSNTGDEGETSESFGVSDCTVRSGDLDNEEA